MMLAEAAGPGEILISQQTQQLAAGAIETDSAGPDRFLLRSAHIGLRPLAVRLDAPLVGRGEEIRRLEAAYDRATRERVTMTVTVTGEAGLGKTRLVQEFAGRLGQEAQVLTGRCLPYGEGITFWPLQEVVRQASGGDSPERIKVLLDGEADAAAVAEQLHRALGPGTQGRTAAAETFWAARRLLEALARHRPVLVVFEDLHWAEPTLLDLVESLALRPGRSAIVVVCIARPELLDQRPAWAAEADRSVSIQLAPLGEDPAAALLDSLSAGHRIAPSTRARLIETAGGNPLYLEQLAVSLSEQSGSDIRPALPPTIQALLSARLQRLGPGASSVLVRAAIVGKDFGEREIRGLLPVEARAPLSRNLQTLVAKGLVQRGPPGRSPYEEYSFRHILIQEVAYHSIPKSLRAELHHRYADWLEVIVSDSFPARSEILGYHLEQSVRYHTELWPADPESAALSLRAAAHLETAGFAAHDRGDDVAAVNLLDRAAALLPGDDPALGRLYTSLGTVLIEAGQFEKAEATLDHAQRITAANGDQRQHAHARVEALLLHLKVNPNRGGNGDRPSASRIAPRVRGKPGRPGNLPHPATRGRAALGPLQVGRRRIRLAACRRLCPQGERPEATGRYSRLARLGRALGPNTRARRDTTMQGLPRRDREPPHRKGRDPAEPGRPLRDAGRLRGGTGNAQHREIPRWTPSAPR